MEKKPISVTHIITDLNIGGAEMMLTRLVSSVNKTDFDYRVISLKPEGPLAQKIREAGVPVESLGMRLGLRDIVGFFKLVSLLRRSEPDIVQTWMYHADLIGGVAAKLAGPFPVIWNVRHSTFDDGIRHVTRGIRRVLAFLSRWIPVRVVANAQTARDVHIFLGYQSEKIIVIPNGFDLKAFHPDPAARLSVRRELGLDADAVLIGLVARYHQQKDHRTFVQAAGCLAPRHPGAHFVLCGENIDRSNSKLLRWIEATGYKDHFHLLGQRDDMPRITASLDIAASSSAHGEGFSNVIGEAMSCGVPCVVTDVGDSAHIVGDTGAVVLPRDPGALCDAWMRILSLNLDERQELGRAARERIKSNFSLPAIVQKYEWLYKETSQGLER